MLNVFLLKFRSNCKNFLDTYAPSDKGRGKSCLPVSSPQSRIQNATKRSPATYGHSQKKHKCSAYYGRHRGSAAVASSAGAASEDKPAPAKGDGCPAGPGEAWVGLRCAGGLSANLQKSLALPRSFLGKEENTLKSAVAASSPSEGHVKEGAQTCMFPKETDFQISESVAELKEREVCQMRTPKKLPENHLPRSSPQCQSDLPDISRKNNGNLFLLLGDSSLLSVSSAFLVEFVSPCDFSLNCGCWIFSACPKFYWHRCKYGNTVCTMESVVWDTKLLELCG